MKDFIELFSVLDSELIKTQAEEHSKVVFDYFADQVDNSLQNALVSELIVRYADMSKQLEDKNKTLRRYNEHLEEIVQEKVNEISASQIATIHALVKAAETRDDDTGAHIERTSLYCRVLAEKLREAGMYKSIMNDAFAENIARASPLHDIGKIGIRDSILLKPGPLTSEEFEIMKTHVIIGHDTLSSVVKMHPGNMFLKFGLEISMYHHEKWDGSGYMYGRSKEDIPLSARIMAVSDVYDALRSKRVYKEAYSHEKTISIISDGSGYGFDPALIEVFLRHNLLFRDIYNKLSG
ncbi:MAG: HD domain-containing protein [Synergistaceae bacterium]|nr:HD domain-containing protein [Synergistaceae bacterium]